MADVQKWPPFNFFIGKKIKSSLYKPNGEGIFQIRPKIHEPFRFLSRTVMADVQKWPPFRYLTGRKIKSSVSQAQGQKNFSNRAKNTRAIDVFIRRSNGGRT